MPDVTITLTTQQAQRLAATFVTPDNPTPTVADYKQWVIRQSRARVHQHERRVAEAAVQQPDPFDPT